jgi:sporulation protein YlmC with PRC-barrel domain
VVQPKQGEAEARLVPIQLAKGRDDEQREIELECTLDEAHGFESVHEAAYLRLDENPVQDPDWDVGVTEVLAMPYYDTGVAVDPYLGDLDSQVAMYYDRVPKGKVEVRRASAVISADGHSLGEVDGFVVDADEHITHFVLERGHLFGRKEVTIPIGAVASVESDAVHIALSKDEVGALPTVRVGRHG